MRRTSAQPSTRATSSERPRRPRALGTFRAPPTSRVMRRNPDRPSRPPSPHTARYAHDIVPQMPCAPRSTACPGLRVPTPSPDGYWPYARTGGTLSLGPSDLPSKQPAAWRKLAQVTQGDVCSTPATLAWAAHATHYWCAAPPHRDSARASAHTLQPRVHPGSITQLRTQGKPARVMSFQPPLLAAPLLLPQLTNSCHSCPTS